MDLGIEVILELFSKEGMEKVFESASNIETDNSKRIFALKKEYAALAILFHRRPKAL